MVDYISQYLSTVRERQVTPNVQPGYLRAQLPASAPEEPDSWDSIFGDIERVIMPGVRHCNCRGDPRLQGTQGGMHPKKPLLDSVWQGNVPLISPHQSPSSGMRGLWLCLEVGFLCQC